MLNKTSLRFCQQFNPLITAKYSSLNSFIHLTFIHLNSINSINIQRQVQLKT